MSLFKEFQGLKSYLNCSVKSWWIKKYINLRWRRYWWHRHFHFSEAISKNMLKWDERIISWYFDLNTARAKNAYIRLFMTHFINSVEKIICDTLTFDRFSSCAQCPLTNTFFLAMGISIIFQKLNLMFF